MKKTCTVRFLYGQLKWGVYLLLLLPVFLPAQSVYFLNTFGGPSQDIGQSAIQTFDKQFVSVGSTSSYGAGSSDIWLVKSWSNGFPRWNHCIGGAGVDLGYCVKETPADSGLVIAGYTDSFGAGGYDCYLIKTDSLGTVLWSKTYGGPNWDFAYSLAVTSDGGFILAGGTYSYGAGDEDVYVVRTNASGDTLWTRCFGGKKQDEARSVKQTLDGGFIIAGMTKSFGDSLNGDAYLIRLNAFGDTLWTRTSGGAFAEDAHDVLQAADSSFFLLGATASYSTPPGSDVDIYLAKFQPNGTPLNTNHIGGPAYDRGEAMVESSPQHFTLVGSTKSFGWGSGYLNVVTYFFDQFTNYAGGGHTYGDTIHASDAEGYSICNTSDHGYLISGYTNGFKGNGIPDFLLIKTDSVPGYVHIIAGISSISPQGSFVESIYPNPTDEQTSIRLSASSGTGNLKFRLLDLSGRNLIGFCKLDIYRNTEHTELRLQFDRQHLPSGMYFFETDSGQGKAIAKISLR
jgi:hypothetical protein